MRKPSKESFLATSKTDPQYDLTRFVDAQESTFEGALAEVRQGRKVGHWMWFIFPQIAGLGESRMSQEFAIKSLQEAEEYLAHPILGPRLKEISEQVLRIQDRSALEIFGFPDNLKLCSSMTLFAHATKDNAIFLSVIAKYFQANFDQKTLDLLRKQATGS